MWIELLPNLTMLNDPTYFPPRLFAQLFTSLGETQFRLFLERDRKWKDGKGKGEGERERGEEGGAVRLLMEIDDSIAPSAVEYAKALLRAEVYQCDPPSLRYMYRLEATLAKPCAFPISFLTREWIDRYAPSSQSQMPPPTPAEALLTAVYTYGTAVEVVARASRGAAEEVARQVIKLQRGKKVKEGLPIPGDELITKALDTVYDGGTKKPSTKYIEPAKDRKIDVASEKVLSTIFECNVFVYGDSEEDVKNTLASFVSTSMNSLRPLYIKRLRSVDGWKEEKHQDQDEGKEDQDEDQDQMQERATEGSATEAGAPQQGQCPPDAPWEDERIVLEDAASPPTPLSEPPKSGGAKGKEGAGSGWSFRERVSKHWFGRHRGEIRKYAAAGMILGTAAVHMWALSKEGITFPVLMKMLPSLDPLMFLPELAACGAAAAFFALFSVFVKEYKTVGLNEFELASIFSFPSPSPNIPVRSSSHANGIRGSEAPAAVSALKSGASGDVKWWFGS